jgi:hypothetical protein
MKKHLWIILGLTLASGLFAAPLQVIQRHPMGEMDSLRSASEVVVVFNQPMVALGTNEDMAKLCPLQIEPALPGRCRLGAGREAPAWP